MTRSGDQRGRKGDRADFWSRRRAAVREAEERSRVERILREDAGKAAELEKKTDREILEELGLPDPDALGEGADFKPFLRTVVPERIRRRALRRLWSLNPVLANLDGLVEYGEDFTDAATVVDGLQTAYQVGKGMLRHVEEMERQAGLREPGEIAGPLPGGEGPVEDAVDGPDGSGEPAGVAGARGSAHAPAVAAGAPADDRGGGESTDAAMQHPSDAGTPALTPPDVPQDTSTRRSPFGVGANPGSDMVGDAEAPVQPAEPAGPARRRMRFS